jgi:RND family efflux transporter MFP subunit
MQYPQTPSHFKRNAIIVIALCALLALGGALFYTQSQAQDDKNGKKQDAPPAASKPALSVQSVRPQSASLAQRLSANGNITAWQEAVVGAEVNGLRLSEVRVNVGDVVRKGQVLATFAAEGTQADVAQARATVAEAEAAAAEAVANAARARSLKDTGAISEQQVTQFLTAEQATKARVQAAKAALASQNLNLKHAQVLAPDSGVISARMATVGSVASPGQELFRLIRQGRLEWRGEVTASEVARIAPGMLVQVTTAGGTPIQGKVRIVAPTVDAQTRNSLVYVDVPAHPSAKAGMFAKGEFELGATQALTLPQQALVLRDGFSYAFRIGADNKVSQVKLQVGRRVGDQVEVLSGISPEHNFVASGAAFLADGDTVRLVAAPAASAAPKAAVAGEKPAQTATK